MRDIKRQRTNVQGVKVFNEYLIGNSFLKVLNLEKNDLFEEEMLSISEGLTHNESLTSLSLGWIAPVKKEALISFCTKLNTCTSLKSLTLNDKHCMVRASSFLENSTCLTSLHLVGQILTQLWAVDSMCDAFSKNTSLREFGLLSMTMKDTNYVKSLGEALTKNSSLTLLDLSGTEMNIEGETIITEIRKSKNIELKWNNKRIPRAIPMRLNLKMREIALPI